MTKITRKLRITHKIIKDSYRAIIKVWNPDPDTIARDIARFAIDENKKQAKLQELESVYDFDSIRKQAALLKARRAA